LGELAKGAWRELAVAEIKAFEVPARQGPVTSRTKSSSA
jgi:hypothetical protein